MSIVHFKEFQPYAFDVERARNIDFKDIRWGCLNIRSTLGDLLVSSYNGSPNCYAYVAPKEFLGSHGEVQLYKGVYPNIFYHNKPVDVKEFRKAVFSKCGNVVYKMLYLADRYMREGYDALAVSFFMVEKDMYKSYKRGYKKYEDETGSFFDRCYLHFQNDMCKYLELYNFPCVVEVEDSGTDVSVSEPVATKQLKCFKNFSDNFGGGWDISGSYEYDD